MLENLLLTPLFWTGIGFVIVLFIIATKGRGAVLNSSYERIERITEEIKSVEQLREDAQLMLQEQEKKYREVIAEIHDLVETTNEESVAISKQMEQHTKGTIEIVKNRSADAILRAEVDATSQIKTVSLDKAILLLNQVLKTPEIAEQIVDSTLVEIKSIK